ncbi:hypothetical protein BGZ92_002596 [Podila epicladia]|nr:hypothetical protein BGZ92_002596 [Podila epicladia]
MVIETTLRSKNQARKVLESVTELKAKIVQHDQALQNIERELLFGEDDALALLHEKIYLQNFSISTLSESLRKMHYLIQRGVRFYNKKSQNGLYHVKIYVMKKKKLAKDIQR